MNDADILNRIIALLTDVSDAEEIKPESDMLSDLGIGSMDLLSVLCSLEEEFGIRLPQRTLRNVVTVADLAAVISSKL